MTKATKQTKLCIFLPSLEHGGAERRMILLAIKLQELGYTVCVVVLRKKGSFEKLLNDAGIPIESVNKGGKWDILFACYKTFKIFRKNHFDIILSCLPSANLFATIIKLVNRKTPLFWGIAAADMPTENYGKWAMLGEKLQKICARFANIIIVNSYKAKAYSTEQGFNTDQLEVIQNGVDVDHFVLDASLGKQWRKKQGIQLEAKVIGIVARLDPVKGIESFIKAVELAHDNDWIYMIFCSGDSEYANQLKATIKGHHLYNTRLLIFEDLIVDSSIYNALDVTTITSISESFPNVMLESMACGTPVVSTDVGDCALVLQNHGAVIPVNKIEQLVDEWQKILDQPNSQDSSLALREYVIDEYSIERMVEKFEKNISELCVKQRSA